MTIGNHILSYEYFIQIIIETAKMLMISDGKVPSIRALSAKLNVDAMAIYYYFKNKEEVFEAVAEQEALILKEEISKGVNLVGFINGDLVCTTGLGQLDVPFKDRTPPEGKTWLEVLIQTSLFRRDPPPYSEEIDPFNPPSELIRFAFQRFQTFEEICAFFTGHGFIVAFFEHGEGF